MEDQDSVVPAALAVDHISVVPDALIVDHISLPTSELPPNDTTPKAVSPKVEVSNCDAISVDSVVRTYTGDQYSAAIT